MRQRLKRWVFDLLGKEPEAVVVAFLSGPPQLAAAMAEEVRRLIPDREHYTIRLEEIASARALLSRKRIAMAAVLFTPDEEYAPLRRLAFRLAPTRILAYNSRLERHHLRLRTAIASCLFVRGVPLDRIFLRPWWLYPFKRDRSRPIREAVVHEGRPATPGRRRIGIVTPYPPYPLSHGGAVRMYNLIRELAPQFDIFLFAFGQVQHPADLEVLQSLCAKLVLFATPRYREPRWASLLPPEVNEFKSSWVKRYLAASRREFAIELMQIEYTQLATYEGDVLVEHDVTFDLYAQVLAREKTPAARWNWWRWRRFERSALARYRAVIAMAAKDQALLGVPHVRVIPNGVDLARFRPAPERPGARLLFVGSFAHFPNVVAYRWLAEQVLPLLPDVEVTVVAGQNPELYYACPEHPRVHRFDFVRDVRPLYNEANVVVVPTRVSAGTNLKVLEAMAMERAIVSTSSGCGGLGLVHGESVWIADTAEDFAAGVQLLLSDDELRRGIARNARARAEAEYDWKRIAELQRALWNELLPARPISVRRGTVADLARIHAIERSAHTSAHWEADSYLGYDTAVAEVGGAIAGFIVSRPVAQDQREILNVAVAPEFRRTGVATVLINSLLESDVFLEVRVSNASARTLYRKLGFAEVGTRREYYDNPVEDAVVMQRSRVG
ncbi:MAG TPA: GNAT family N-acetyltransferase [Bryobacteraceae bacterium]|nr:GNAT family N-acetyltransferase [Bryobacteraceae bacterium]